ncbi:transporter [Gemmatimonadetes bacterium T265]|nr:transporter [Gemmatimonadetes bacterium T265]
MLQTAPPLQSPTDAVGLVARTLRGMVAGSLARLPYFVIGLVVLLLFYVAGRLVRRVAHEAGERTRLDVELADIFGKLAVILVTALGVLVAAVIVFPSFTPAGLVQGLGVTSVAVGFAFKDILQNFFAGILILLRKPFVVGDQIRVKDFEGTVEEITTRSTRLKTYDGERVVLPNGDVYTSSILVRTAYPTRRVKFGVGVGYPDSIEEARAAILRVVGGAEGVLADPAPSAYVEELAGSSVNFAVYFWTDSHQANVLAVRDRVATGIKHALDAAKIDMPFPHTVVLFHDQTGNSADDAAGDAPARGRNGARAAGGSAAPSPPSR